MDKLGKRLVAVVLAVMMLLGGVGALGTSAATSGNYEYSVSNGNATITKYTGTATTLTIPSVLDGYPVKSIGDRAFRYCNTLENITVPSSIESIGINAFFSCSQLATVSLTTGLIAIGVGAFGSCRKLASISIPSSVTSIGAGAFDTCVGLETVVLPEGLTSIPDSCFQWCRALTTINIPNSVTAIGNAAFQNCDALQNVVLPQGLKTIGYNAFYYCASIKTITIPDSVTSIGHSAFGACHSLATIVLPSNISNIDTKGLFAGCQSLSTVSIPQNVAAIGNEMFSRCKSLISVTIPVGVKTIGDYAFSSCDNLESIVIPDGATSIGYRAFANCTSLTAITIPQSVKTIDGVAFSNCPNVTFYCYKDSYAQQYAERQGIPYVLLTDQPTTYTITYKANGGFGAPAAQTKTPGVALTLNDTRPTREDYIFRGWAASSTATAAQWQPGDNYAVDGDATLWAVWVKFPFPAGNVQARIAQLQSVLGDGVYFSANGKACSGGTNCQDENCSLWGTMNRNFDFSLEFAKSVSVPVNTCVAFARFAFWYIFGVKGWQGGAFTNACIPANAEMEMRPFSEAKLGDIVVWTTDGSSGHYAIYLGPNSYYQSNSETGSEATNRIRYGTSYPGTPSHIIRAKNYDAINGVVTSTLTLNANGGSVTPTTHTSTQGQTYNLPTPTRNNHTFTGWTLSGGGSLNGSTYTFGTSNGMVTAQWTANSQPPVTPSQWWESLPSFVQWILRWLFFGFIWMN